MLMLAAAFAHAAGEDNEKSAPERKWAIGSDIADWAELICPNMELQYCGWDHIALTGGIKYNPFTFRKGSPEQTQMRQLTPFIGMRYWFDVPYRNWYMEGRLAGSVYSVANVFCGKCFEGNLAALEFGGGWSTMISEQWNLSVGAGIAAALHNTTRYLGPVCGRIDGSDKGFILLPDITISISYLW